MRIGTRIAIGLAATLIAGCGKDRPREFHVVQRPVPPPDSFATPTPAGSVPTVPRDAISLDGFGTRVDLPPGTSVDLPFHIRRGAYSGAVGVGMRDPARAIVAADVVVPAGEHDGVLHLTSSDAAAASDATVRGIRLAAWSIDAYGAWSDRMLEVSRGWSPGDFAGGANPDCLSPMLAPTPEGGLYVLCVRRLNAGVPEHDELIVERRTPEGAPDAGFGRSGRIEIDPGDAITDVRPPLVSSTSLAIAIDTANDAKTESIGLLTSWSADGTPIATFGTNGALILPGTSFLAIGRMSSSSRIVTVESQDGEAQVWERDARSGDGRSWGVGDSGSSWRPTAAWITADRIYATDSYGIECYLERGPVDTGFGILGKMTGAWLDWILPDGSLVDRFSHSFEPVQIALLRRDAHGNAIVGFGANGVVDTEFMIPSQVDEDSRGFLVAAGNETDEGAGGYAVYRYRTDGSFDAALKFHSPVPSTEEAPLETVVLADDRVVVLQNGALRVLPE